MSSASRTPRTVTALSDITKNLVDTKTDLSAGKERVPAKAHQRAPSNKAKPSQAAAATASHLPNLSSRSSLGSLGRYIGGAADEVAHTNMRASLSSPQQAIRPCKPNDAASSILTGMGISASLHMLCCAQALVEDAELRSRPGLLRLCLLQMRGQHELQRVVETLGEEIKALRSTVTKQSVDNLKRKEALLRFGTVQTDYWNANPDFHSSALSLYAYVLSTARSDLRKLIRRTHLDEIDIVQALQIWYKDHPLAHTDEHLVWWSVLCVVKRHEGGEKKREYWQVHSTVANDLATKAGQHHGSKRYCPDGMFDCATLYYPESQHPKMMQAKVSTTDSSFQAVRTLVLGTYQPSADFRHLVLDRAREMAEGTLKGQDELKHGE
ncbi:hypothetical protein MVLG_05381 [Microbotryum lychnidis-dioicae p1A1 Lamole]|uniref:Uncharacterized protein n=1 Tax=Microbotryum lychnidis-dioicae (strain p1A1 Lamole / MvSl-1064) TaxID=683840 RepID=U5HE31_USTV1|nr:hypothetical protein MVLG_05381 [Microbotryum lychnidis-dioicae p1A1 Lamole]|eukprot:KDE04155.1 hypothetical protein MVLG_05381 [Microbotryum lychnidis-dioicae p1A1 Lamole]